MCSMIGTMVNMLDDFPEVWPLGGSSASVFVSKSRLREVCCTRKFTMSEPEGL
jgi:hypothetical protein